LITVFSASHYTGAYNNLGAVVILTNDSKNDDGTIKPVFEQFTSEIINKEKTLEKAKNETLQQIKDRIYLNRNELLVEFFKCDKEGSGIVSVTDWYFLFKKI
jgi:hypothetical protein